jgi:hypothetical protein
MRHNREVPARPTTLRADSGIDANRAGIRALDCGYDDRDDGAPSSIARADESQAGRSRSPKSDIALDEPPPQRM